MKEEKSFTQAQPCDVADTPSLQTNRRQFIQSVGAGSLLAAGSSLVAPFAWAEPSTQEAAVQNVDKTVWSACMVNCGSRCPLKCHVSNVNGKDVIRYLTTDDTTSDEFDHFQIRACLRGRSARKRVYNPDRLLYPMRRVGKRGEGKFERISWDEAIKTIAEKLQYTIKTYGSEAVYYQYATGTNGYVYGGREACRRLLRLSGGYLDYYGSYSTAQIGFTMPFIYGDSQKSYSREMSNAKLVLSFGYNPAETRMSGGGETYQYGEWTKKNNTKTIIIDPRYTDTMLGKENEWIPIRVGTDAALASAIAYVLITGDMVDQEFLDKYCVGYDEKTLPAGAPKNGHYKAYILGQGEDGIAKTPEWASKITGIPAEKIVSLAKEIGTTKPVYVTQGWGVQRQANGEQSVRAITMLAILTGNIGLPGTNSGEQPGMYSYKVPGYPAVPNPVKAKIPVFLWTDAIVHGKEMTALSHGVQGVDRLNQPIKFIWNYSGNTMTNQHSDINATDKILQDESLCEFIVVIDNHMVHSALYADILLPDVTNFENSDIIPIMANMGVVKGAYFISPAIEPMGECKTAYQVCVEVARHLGIEQEFTQGNTYEDWLQGCYAKMLENDESGKLPPTLEEARQMGVYKEYAPEGLGIAYQAFRKDPVTNPLKTPSGKIEIYSERLAKIAETWELAKDDIIKALPEYAPSWEGVEDEAVKKEFPLQCFGFHTKGRTHSTYHNVDLLRQAVEDALWINPVDAKARGIKNGDSVQVRNKRGTIQLPAKVTPRIMPGVVALGQGAWFKANEQGVDVGGCINTLTTMRPSPLSKGNPQHTNLVEVQKAV